MNALAAGRALAAYWPATYESPSGLAMSIEVTRYAVEAFRAAGLEDVEPLPVQLTVYNAAATAAMLSHTEPTHSAMKLELPPGGRPRRLPHLVVEHPRFLLDLALGAVVAAVGSPAGLEHVRPVCVEKDVEVVLAPDGAWTSMSTDAVAVRWLPCRRRTAWRRTPEWCEPLDGEVVELLADALRGSELEGKEPAE